MYLIVFVLLQFTAVICNEPGCSRFHYEEKLLEKMVRLEFQVEQMKKERQQLRDALANMRTEVRMQMTTMEGELRKNTAMLDRLNGKFTFQGVLFPV